MASDLDFISLLIDNESIVNGLGVSLPMSKIIEGWAHDYRQFYAYMDAGEFPENYHIFIPDFWHIAYGDAKCLPKEAADALWNSAVTLRNDARLLNEDWSELVVYPCPGQRIGIRAGRTLGG